MKTLKTLRSERNRHKRILETASSLKEALNKIGELEAHVEAIRKLKASQSSFVISPREKSGVSEAVAVAVATDWHIGETIKPEQVSGLNTFNIAIAKRRIVNFFELVVKLTNKERQDVKIDELVLFLGGDL